MPQVSKYPVSKEVYERIFDIFLKSISSLNTKTSTAKFLKEFLTPTEQTMLAKRLAIGFLLVKGYDYQMISKILRVSTGTISKVSYYLKSGKYYKLLVIKLLEDEKIDDFMLKIGEIITSLMSSGRSKSGSWIYLREEIKKKRKERVL